MNKHPYDELTPDQMLIQVEKNWLPKNSFCTGFLFTMGSYENRVVEMEIEHEENAQKQRVVVKFYRPNRWSESQILEEHLFLQDLSENEVPVIAPLRSKNNRTVESFELNGQSFLFTVFPKMGGRQPEDFKEAEFERLGRQLARLHSVGSQKKSDLRIKMGVDSFIWQPLHSLKACELWEPANEKVILNLLQEVENIAKQKLVGMSEQRIHGDCHKGNLLLVPQLGSSQSLLTFLDFDDFMMGPVVQDLWLLLPEENSERYLAALLDGYEEIRYFNTLELKLIEVLRGFRLIHYAGWIAKRWGDPAFKKVFEQFGQPRYWNQWIVDLETQLNRMLR